MLILTVALILIVMGIVFLFLSADKSRALRDRENAKPLISSESLAKKEYDLKNYVNNSSGIHRGKRSQSYLKNAYSTQDVVFYREFEVPKSKSVANINEEISLAREGDDDSPQMAESVTVIDRAVSEEQGVKAGDPAVLFEDTENSVTFSGLIDPSNFTRFDNLRRVGRGGAVLNNDSISFHFENKLYKFDFYRLKDVRGDGKAVLIFPDNLNFPFLLLSENDNDFAARAISKYLNFKKG